MWTPKRIILLAVGFLLFTFVYLAYSLTSLGRINTLPPLPEHYKISGSPGEIARKQIVGPTPLEKKMVEAFGPGCEEMKWQFQLEMNAKNMVLAAINCQVEDGRVKFSPMSLALFSKEKNDGRGREINTLKCDQAYIRFDRRINSLSPTEMNGRKIVEAQLIGSPAKPILITNNRRTTSVADDLVVTINNGPVYYIEKTQLVKTSDIVHIVDGKPTARDGQRLIPPKADIYAKGMEMELTTSSPPPRPGLFPASKAKNDSISGVKRIVLKENVTMNLCVAGGGPFPGNDKTSNRAKPPNGGKKADGEVPSRLRIVTPGRFEYKLFKDHDEAYFDVPNDDDMPSSPQDVTVERLNGDQGGNDMLVCKHLELRLKRRANDPAAKTAAASDEQGLEIETVHATGPYVTLTSDAEKLDAHGNDFFHDTLRKLTILKGTPFMEANKEDSVIQAPVLQIQDLPLTEAPPGDKTAKTTYQQVQANGPGCIHMTNKTTHKQTTHAYWKDRLLSTRDKGLDLMVLTGAARFEDWADEEHKQSLKAEELKVWLLPDEKKPVASATSSTAAQGPEKSASSSRRPHVIEASRNVFAQSKEMIVHDTAHLIINFLDVPEARMPPPSGKDNPAPRPAETQKPAPRAAPAAPAPSTPSLMTPPPILAAKPATAATAKAKTETQPQAKEKEKEKEPIYLSARSIEARVLRCEERMALDHLWAEGGASEQLHKRGGVRVRQAPDASGDNGVDIESNTLDMACTADGNVLFVTGDLAFLEMGKIKILGPEIHVDQAANKVWVDGRGAMRLQSNTTLENKPLDKPVPLTIHWSDRMLFTGLNALFYGEIQADQGNARLACQRLQVLFDRPISLKHGAEGERSAKAGKVGEAKSDGAAKVSQIVGDEDVRAEDQTIENGQLEKYQLLMGSYLVMDTVPRDDEPPRRDGKTTDANKVKLSGPGSVRILQRGGSDPAGMPGAPTPGRNAALAADKSQEMKLTYVRFEKCMLANNLTNVANFYESVRVLNMPCDNPRREIDLDAIVSRELPPGTMYLRCNQLKVSTRKVPIKDADNSIKKSPHDKQPMFRTYQEMEARGQVFVQSQEFSAQCDLMTFNEEKDQVIFHGQNGNAATLSKVSVKGGRPYVYQGKKIIYYRTTGKIDGDDVQNIQY